MAKPRVVHVIESFELGGAEILLAETLPLLTDEFEVSVLALLPPTTLIERFRAAGIDADVLATDGSAPTWRYASIRALIAELRRRPAAILHTHLYNAHLAGRVAAASMLHRAPRIVATLHNPDYSHSESSSPIRASVLKWVDWGTTLATNVSLVAVSNAVAADYQHHFRRIGPWRNIDVIHNSIDVEKFATDCDAVDRASARAHLGWSPTELAILSVGRLTLQKNYTTLIDTVRLLRQRGLDTTAVVIGEGPEGKRLRAACGDLVRFVGRTDRPAIVAAMAACDIYVQPSIFEAFGMAILEAMAAGRPVVASAVDGIPEVVGDGVTGRLVPAGDAAQLADKVAELATDRATAKAFGAAGRQRAYAIFSNGVWRDRTSALYRRLGATSSLGD